MEYVKRLQAQGYDINSIRSQLVNSGYSPFDVAQAIKITEKTSVKKQFKVPSIKIASLFILLIILSFSIYFFWPSSVKIIEFNTFTSNKDVPQGGNLLFYNSIRSDIKKQVFVELNHKIIDRVGKIILNKKEIVSFVESVSSPTDISLLSNIPIGDYEVQSSLNYNKQSLTSKLFFSIKESSKDFGIKATNNSLNLLDCPGGCDDFNSCTNDRCINGNCMFELKINCCGNNVCEASESESSCSEDCKQKTSQTSQDLIQQAKDNISKGAEKAARYCNQISDKSIRDDCFLELTKESNNSLFCSSISDNGLRDSCFIDVILTTKDYSLCNKLLDDLLKNNCFLMEKISNP